MRPAKLVSAIAGVLLVIAGFAMSVGGGFVLAVSDDDGWMSIGPVRVGTGAVALVGDDIDIDFGDRVAEGRTFVGWDAIATRLDVASRNGKDVFVGVARQGDAEAYLAGVAVDRFELLEHEPDLVATGGSDRIAPPADQDIWVATGIDGALEWDASDGRWSVVVLNADGSAGVDVALTGSARIPFLEAIGVAALVFGLLSLTLGGFLTYMGVRAVRPRPQPTPRPPAGTVPVV